MHMKLLFIYSCGHYQGKKQILVYKVIVTWPHAVLLYLACEPSLQQLRYLSSPHVLLLKCMTKGGSAVWSLCKGIW